MGNNQPEAREASVSDTTLNDELLEKPASENVNSAPVNGLATKQSPDSEDDLEEGELKDDDDDEDDDDEDNPDKQELNQDKIQNSSNSRRSSSSSSRSRSRSRRSRSSSNSSSTSTVNSRKSTSTKANQSINEELKKVKDESNNDEKASQADQSARASSSSSSVSGFSKELSSKSSSQKGSHYSLHTRSSLSNQDLRSSKRLSLTRTSLKDRFRTSRERERQDPSEKAAKLISMRTKLLEARSREIEMKLNKNRNVHVPPQRLSIGSQRMVKMTITKPIISYSENPNPPPVKLTAVEPPKKQTKVKTSDDKSKKSKRKTKKKSKKKKKHSSKKTKKHKSAEFEAKGSGQPIEEPVREVAPPYELTDHQGPKTPPDNHVVTLDDKQIEWPSHLIRMTVTIPSISYSVNPRSLLEPVKEERDVQKEKRPKNSSTSVTNGKRKRKHSSDSSSSSSSSSSSASSSSSTTSSSSSSKSSSNQDSSKLHIKTSAQRLMYDKPKVYATDLNVDYKWYCDYFTSSYEMNLQQAQHLAQIAIISAGTYKTSDVDDWLKQRGLSRESTSGLSAQKLYPFSLKDGSSTLKDSSVEGENNFTEHGIKQELESHSGGGMQIPVVTTRIARNQVNRDVDELQENKPNVTPNLVTSERSGDSLDGLVAPIVKSEVEPQEHDLSASFQASNSSCLKLRPVDPKFVVIKSTKEVVLPNGQILPPGTLQKIVHPYPKFDSDVLGPFCDFY